MRNVQVGLQDDIDGREPARTVLFSLDGKDYEMDLTDERAAELRDGLAPWIAAGREISTARIREPRSRSRRPAEAAVIRRWAEDNGLQVATRGRLPVDLRARYEAAH